jgi:NarL family two-component system response regulator LiaR
LSRISATAGAGPGDPPARAAPSPAGPETAAREGDARELDGRLDARRPPRILVIGDDPPASRRLRRTLERAGADVIAAAPAGRDGLDLARRYAPDIVFVDLRSPRVDGVALIDTLAGMELGIRPILLTVARDPDDGLAAIRAGARGYLCRSDLDSPSLPRLLGAVMSDELVCSRGIMTAIVDRLVQSPPLLGDGHRPVRSRLTSREWEVLDLLCVGGTTDGIADELVISTETVRTHLKNVMRKLGASSRAEVVAQASRLRRRRAG